MSLSKSAARELGYDKPKFIGTSFIEDFLFQKWKTEHPGWKVVEKAGTRAPFPAIRVPSVEIAGLEAGPVWFCR